MTRHRLPHARLNPDFLAAVRACPTYRWLLTPVPRSTSGRLLSSLLRSIVVQRSPTTVTRLETLATLVDFHGDILLDDEVDALVDMRCTSYRDEAIRDAYLTGKTQREVAARFELSSARIGQILKKLGAIRSCSTRNAAIRNAYLAEKTLQEIKTQFKLSLARIRQILRKQKTPLRASKMSKEIRDVRTRSTAIRDAAIRDAYLAGKTLSEVGARSGLSAMTVMRALERQGVSRRAVGSYDRHVSVSSFFAHNRSDNEQEVSMEFKETAKEICRDAEERGFTAKVPEDDPAFFSEKLLLIISEISEAFEEWRSNHGLTEIYYDPQGLKPEGVPIELADAVIRILHFCEANGINLERAIRLKMDYNKTRPFRHGGKKA